METRGFRTTEVLAGSEINVDRLNDPSYLIHSWQAGTVVRNMMALTGNRGLGFEIGRDLEFTDFGILGYATLSSKNLREVAMVWRRYSETLLGNWLQLELKEHSRNTYSLSILNSAVDWSLYSFHVEEWLMVLDKTTKALSCGKIEFTRLELSYAAPEHHALYRQYLGCDPEFNAKKTSVTCNLPDLDMPLRGGDEEFNAICVQYCSQIFRHLTSSSDLAARLRSLFFSLRGQDMTIERAAIQLNMTPRTLRHKLKKEGLTFGRLQNEFRLDLAKEYLRSEHFSPKEVSYMIGYKSACAFRRAFKERTGQTVGEYLTQNRDHQS